MEDMRLSLRLNPNPTKSEPILKAHIDDREATVKEDRTMGKEWSDAEADRAIRHFEALAKAETEATAQKRTASEALASVEQIAKRVDAIVNSPDKVTARIEKAAEEIRKSDGKLTKEQAFVEAMRRNPQFARDYASGTLDQYVVKSDDPGLSVALSKAADTVHAANPNLTREQAVARALKNNPDLYQPDYVSRKGY